MECSTSVAEHFVTTLRIGGKDQIYLKQRGRLRCFGGDAGTAGVPASALKPASFPSPFVITVNFAAPSVMSVIPGGAGNSINGGAGSAFLSF